VTAWPTGRAPDRRYPSSRAPERAALGSPLPPGRGLWRLTLHERTFSGTGGHDASVLAELDGARSRQLVQEYNKGASLGFVLDGSSSAAGMIRELEHDVIAWRWDEATGTDVPVFRGVVTQSQDTLSEQADTVTFTCHDYLAALERRLLTSRVIYTATDQDAIVGDLIARAVDVTTSGGQSLAPGSYLPLDVRYVDPAGADRAGLSEVYRDRTYEASQKIDEAVFNLAAVEGGFDLDVTPGPGAADLLRVFYPYQGTLRLDVVLEYGSSVAALSRSVNSADYANYWRVMGAPADASVPGSPNLYAEDWNEDANNVTVTPVGLWQSGDNASDVTLQGTLNDKARADLNMSGVLVPSYTLTLRPGWYRWGALSMGDVVTLRIRAGRLDVESEVRVVGITYDLSDDGAEDVALTVGRPDVTFSDLFTRADRDINALARR
jgi:hypothetical protein